jgi:hypothetical protein
MRTNVVKGVKRAARNGERGTAFVEFAIVGSVLFLLMLWVVPIGINLGNMVHVSHVTRDIGNLYSRGVEFDKPSSQLLAESLAGTHLTGGSGIGVLILTRVRRAYPEDCTDAGLGTCPNVGKTVITQRIVIGDGGLRTSDFGSPNMAMLTAAGNAGPNDFLMDPSFIAQNIDPEFARVGYTPQQGESIFLVEYYVKPSNYDFLGAASTGVYARSAF